MSPQPPPPPLFITDPDVIQMVRWVHYSGILPNCPNTDATATALLRSLLEQARLQRALAQVALT